MATGFDTQEVQTMNRDAIARPKSDLRARIATCVGPESHAKITDTDGATVTMDFTKGSYHSVTFAGNRTIAFTDPEMPCELLVEIIQDATGSRTATWPSTVKWAGGSAPTLTATASRIDRVWFFFNGTNYIEKSQKLNFTA